MTKKSEAKKENTHPNERSDVAKKQLGPASLFGREAEVSVWSVKNKKLFERSEFFLFSGEKCRSRQKSADGEFLCFVSLFVQRNEEPSRLEREQSVQALAAFEQKALSGD